MTDTSPHSIRHILSLELHARPFAALSAPGWAAYLAFMPKKVPGNAEAEYGHLISLLSYYGITPPSDNRTHWSGRLGEHYLKWERHTEFASFTLFGEGETGPWTEHQTAGTFPGAWVKQMPDDGIASVQIQVLRRSGDDGIADDLATWLQNESLVVSRMLDNSLIAASDFRIDDHGHTRFALFARPETDRQRVGRVVQRLCEIETYKTLAMIGLSKTRELGADITKLEHSLTDLANQFGSDTVSPSETLHELLNVSASLEHLIAGSSCRFSATRAYDAIVNQRLQILREERFESQQTFGEFMMRRYDPSIRTVLSTEAKLAALTEQAGRAADLLRTRVDVDRSQASQALLASVNHRTDLQLRLQKTVEGLSVAAISYYAVNLTLYLCWPLADAWHISKSILAAACTPPVIFAVWYLTRRIRRKLH